MEGEFFYLCCIAGTITAAALHPHLKTAFLFLWIAQVLVGFYYFAMGCETLAILQLLVATTSTVCLLFFYILVHTPTHRVSFWTMKPLFLRVVLGGLLGSFVLFSKSLFTFWISEKEILHSFSLLQPFSFTLMTHHFAVLLLIPFIVFVLVMGGSSICRNEVHHDP